MPDSSKEFLDIQASIEFRFTVKRIRDMLRTYSQSVFADVNCFLGVKLSGGFFEYFNYGDRLFNIINNLGNLFLQKYC